MPTTNNSELWRLSVQPELENEVRICADCGSSFVLSARNAAWYLAKQLNTPRRCDRCRAVRKQQARTDPL